MDERHIVEYELTDDLASRLGRLMVDRYFYGHSFQRQAPFIVIGLIAGLVALFSFGVLEREVFGFLLVVLAMLTGYAWLRRQLLHRDLVWAFLIPFQGQAGRKMRLSLTPTLLDFKVGAEFYEAEWDELMSVWIVPDFWILRLKTGAQFVIPHDVLTLPMEELIRQKARDVEARILED